ncbi:protein FAM200C-like [Palaemon carinicauda]|uniref:protein FAM200C-like n=1 Tax=Palaemon carinicauda TaxID=392227 RepID=UPI0035B58435
MIVALSFVPISHMDVYIDALAQYLPDELQPLLNWVEDDYVLLSPATRVVSCIYASNVYFGETLAGVPVTCDLILLCRSLSLRSTLGVGFVSGLLALLSRVNCSGVGTLLAHEVAWREAIARRVCALNHIIYPSYQESNLAKVSMQHLYGHMPRMLKNSTCVVYEERACESHYSQVAFQEYSFVNIHKRGVPFESTAKRRRYSESYFNIGFTTVLANDGIEKPQCVLCYTILSAESLKPSKLKRHLETKHPEHAKKDLDFFKRHERCLKSQRLDRSGSFQQQSATVLEASYEIAFEIAKQKKPHTIGETLIKPCMMKAVNLILGEASAKKMQQVSLSNNTIQRRISKMSMDVKEQVLTEIDPLFSFQLDESTDVSSCSQLLVFVRYINSGDIKDEFLFCSAPETTTKADDVMEKVSNFFQEEDFQRENVCRVCTDGALAMLGSKSGFQSRVKKLAPQAKGIHCMIHRYALASKTLPLSLQEVLESLIKIVNLIKTKALNTHLFKELCKYMNADHEVLLFYTAVRWLSKGNVINRVFEMKDEIKLFLETQERKDLGVHFEDEAWNKRVAYLADIFDQLNKLNLKLQGRETHVLLFQDSLRAFVSKLQNWRRKTDLGNIAMFEKLCGVMDESHIQLDQFLKDEITEHLQSPEKEVKRYFPELSQELEALVRNPFCTELEVSSIRDEIQDEYLDLRNDSSARDLFKVPILCGGLVYYLYNHFNGKEVFTTNTRGDQFTRWVLATTMNMSWFLGSLAIVSSVVCNDIDAASLSFVSCSLRKRISEFWNCFTELVFSNISFQLPD